MDAARLIREAVAEVRTLREAERTHPPLGEAVMRIKQLQARRFSGTYSDLLGGGTHAAAANFFLQELYSDRDYSDRDAQFARIAGAIERLFPADVAQTAVSLARLHSLTEQLDSGMAAAWLVRAGDGSSEAASYVACWREVGRREDRQRQLSAVLDLGRELIRLTRAPGLRLMLKMMRGPAAAAGLPALQRFLETGFDTFAAMAKTSAAQDFLDTVRMRESAWLDRLFEAPVAACEAELARTLAQTP